MASNVPAPGATVTALFDFAGSSPEDLKFKKGETLQVLKASTDTNWWLARNAKKEQGMVPANYLDSSHAVQKAPEGGQHGAMPWFHGKIKRKDAESMLNRSEVGCFLVRESTNFAGDYTLCVKGPSEIVDYYHIKSMNGKITIDDDSKFSSLEELIEHYSKDADGICHKLVKPLVRQDGKEFREEDFKSWQIRADEIIQGTLLGAGQFGEVFEGTRGGKKVAIKTLKNVQEQARKEFFAEAAVMTELKHDNLVQLIGIVTTGEVAMLVTEFMAKGNLLDYLRSRGRSVVKVETLFKFTLDICSGMAFLEKRGVVHRDLAARNVLISDNLDAKVADFGLARQSTVGSTENGKLPIKWTAPEVLKQKVSTSKSDVWSFGVTMWEIYSYGRSPYPRMSQKDVVDRIPKGYRMDKPEECPADLYEHIMRKAWELDPLNRPTFNRLKKTLGKYAAGKDLDDPTP